MDGGVVIRKKGGGWTYGRMDGWMFGWLVGWLAWTKHLLTLGWAALRWLGGVQMMGKGREGGMKEERTPRKSHGSEKGE